MKNEKKELYASNEITSKKNQKQIMDKIAEYDELTMALKYSSISLFNMIEQIKKSKCKD